MSVVVGFSQKYVGVFAKTHTLRCVACAKQSKVKREFVCKSKTLCADSIIVHSI